MIEEGKKAPAFKAKDQRGMLQKLEDYRGKWVLLYFYPKDFTSGCTTEACAFRDNFTKLGKKVNIIGISKDSVTSHKKFTEKYSLPFTLLSDPNKTIIKKYNAAAGPFTRRISVIIDPEGRVKKIYKKVDPKTHANQILEDVKTLQQ